MLYDESVRRTVVISGAIIVLPTSFKLCYEQFSMDYG